MTEGPQAFFAVFFFAVFFLFAFFLAALAGFFLAVVGARAADGRIAQRVHIVDDDGEAWEALYTLMQQNDGSLKITGCSLLKAGQAV